MTLSFALNAERVLLADSRQPAAAVEPSVPERAGPNLAIRTTRSHKCTTSIPRNPSVPGDVHGRIRATTTWPSKRSCDEKLGCRSFSTVRGYIVHGDVLTVVVSKGRMCVVPTPNSERKEQVSRLASQETGLQSQQCHHQPGSEAQRIRRRHLGCSLVFRRPSHVSGNNALTLTYSSQGCHAGVQIAITCSTACEL